jgi:DNA polymerase elongation subunit (family B)
VNKYGSYIYVTGYKNGEKKHWKEKYQPTLYTKTNKNTPFRTIFDEPLESRQYDSMSDAFQDIKNTEGTNIDLYGNTNFIAQYIAEYFPDGISNIDSSNLNICIFDLEMFSSEGFPHPDEAKYPIISGTFYFSKIDKYIVFGLKKDEYKVHLPNVKFVYCESELELLSKIIKLLQIQSPDIITGYNIRLFDIPYLIHRIEKLLGKNTSKKLSPWNKIFEKSIYIKGKENVAYDILGISQLDYLDLFKKFALNTFGQLENYRLDTVANVVLGERKLDYSEYSSLDELYNNDYQKFIEYNVRDVSLVKNIDEQIRYIDIAMMLAYRAGTNFIDTLGTISVWDSYIYKELLKKNIIVPPSKNAMGQQYAGAYVKEPIPGLYENVVSFDLASLYPNIIVQYNMSPETLISGEQQTISNINDILEGKIRNEKAEKYAMVANGVYFHKEKKGILPELVEGLYNERKEIKKQLNHYKKEIEKDSVETHKKELQRKIDIANNEQMAIKIAINSLYGSLGSTFFRFFDLRIAEGITLTGQLTTKWAEKHINEYLNKLNKTTNIDYVVASDTDSVYLNLNNLVGKYQPNNPINFLDSFCKDKITPTIEEGYQKLFDIMGGYSQRMDMKREKICNKALWTGKKRYILSVLDNEGVRYKEPKLSITGIEAVRSSTPQIIRDKLKESFKIILSMDEEAINNYISNLREEFNKLPVEKIAFPRGVSNVTKFQDLKIDGYIKGTPMHVRAAILYNRLIKEKRLQNKHYEIKNGDKFLFVYLKEPNPIRENVIGFSDVLPKEFELDKYIDYDVQFEKTYIGVIEPILNKIGWKITPEDSLGSFFV